MRKRNIQVLLFILTGGLLISLVSCSKTGQFEDDERVYIDAYLNSNSNLNFVLKPSGLYYLDVHIGSGRLAVRGDTALIMYTGKFLDGTVFDTNVGTTGGLQDTLVRVVGGGTLIDGLDEGLTYMKEGGKSLLLIPSRLGYGPTGYYYIPGYTPLLFDIELVKIKPGPGK